MITEMHPLGKAVAQAINKATYDGDFSEMESLIDEDAMLVAYCGGKMGGIHRGRTKCLTNFARLSLFVENSLRLDTIEMMATDSFVAMLNRATAHRQQELLDGTMVHADLDTMICVVWRFKDGKCVQFYDHFDDADRWDAFWRFEPVAPLDNDTGDVLTAEEIGSMVERISKAGDNQLLREFFAPDIISHVDGHSPLGGTHRGIDEVLSGYGKLHRLCDGQFSVQFENAICDRHFVSIFNRVTATRNGKTIEHIFNPTWRIAGGKVRELWLHFEDVELWDAFWQDV